MMTVLLEPSVLVSTVITLLIALFANRLSRGGDWLLSRLSLLPTWIRVVRWRYRRKLVIASRSDYRVRFALIRAAVFQISFTVSWLLYLVLAIGGLFKGFGALPASVQLLVTCPIYVFEALWLIQSEKAKALARAAERQCLSRSELCRLRHVSW